MMKEAEMNYLQKWSEVVNHIAETSNAERFKEVQAFIKSASEEPNKTIINIILKDYGDTFYSYHPNLMWNTIKNTVREYESYLRIKSILSTFN